MGPFQISWMGSYLYLPTYLQYLVTRSTHRMLGRNLWENVEQKPRCKSTTLQSGCQNFIRNQKYCSNYIFCLQIIGRLKGNYMEKPRISQIGIYLDGSHLKFLVLVCWISHPRQRFCTKNPFCLRTSITILYYTRYGFELPCFFMNVCLLQLVWVTFISPLTIRKYFYLVCQ